LRGYPIVKYRRRHRYIGFKIELLPDNYNIIRSEIINELRKQCKILFDKDCSDIGLNLIRFDGKKGIIRCYHIEKENTIKLLKSIKKISSKNINILTISTSGTIKSLIKKHMNETF
jgi:RNase P/RNase MRP subunit POP5